MVPSQTRSRVVVDEWVSRWLQQAPQGCSRCYRVFQGVPGSCLGRKRHLSGVVRVIPRLGRHVGTKIGRFRKTWNTDLGGCWFGSRPDLNPHGPLFSAGGPLGVPWGPGGAEAPEKSRSISSWSPATASAAGPWARSRSTSRPSRRPIRHSWTS